MEIFTLPDLPKWEYSPDGDFKRLHDRVEEAMNKGFPEHLTYHDFAHTLEVVTVSDMLSTLEEIPEDLKRIVLLAAYGHDTGHIMPGESYDPKGHEYRSAEMIYGLAGKDFNTYEKDYAAKIIPTTETFVGGKFTDPGDDLLAKILCDADVDNLGRKDFFDKGDLLRQELGIEDKQKWYNMSKGLMEMHEFYTGSSKSVRDWQKQKNYDTLVKMIE